MAADSCAVLSKPAISSRFLMERRIIYVGGTSYYGFQGDQLVDESTTPHPKGWGPYIAPAAVIQRPIGGRRRKQVVKGGGQPHPFARARSWLF